MYCVRYSCLVLMKFTFSRQNFKIIFKCQISWKVVQWEPSCSMLTNKQTWRSQKSVFEILRRRLITKNSLASVTGLRKYDQSCLVTVSKFFVAGNKGKMAKATARYYLRNVCLICIYRFFPFPLTFPVTFNRVGRLTHSCCPCPLP